MSTDYRYHLKKGGTKQICPQCGKKTFVLYIDIITGEQLPPQYGRCDREIKCAYHLNPYTDGYVKSLREQKGMNNSVFLRHKNENFQPLPISRPASLIPVELFKQSLKGYQANNLVLWLIGLFGGETTRQLINRYYIGTSKHWPGATVFWQIDRFNKIRTGKIMLYRPGTGRRVKEPFIHITWVHRALHLESFNLIQCYFGEHLLKRYPSNPVGIVESEKTAIIASVYLPQLIWLAAGSLSNLNSDKCQVLTGRNVYLFPDLKGLDKWRNKVKELSRTMYQTRFKVSDFLEQNASGEDKIQGLDLADYLIRFDLQEFRKFNKYSCYK